MTKFAVITPGDWAREIKTARATPNAVSKQIEMAAAELFPAEAVKMLSPKLAWLRKHALETEHLKFGGMECPEIGEEIPHWVCRKTSPMLVRVWAPGEIGAGDTEDAACAAFAKAAGVALWNEEAGHDTWIK